MQVGASFLVLRKDGETQDDVDVQRQQQAQWDALFCIADPASLHKVSGYREFDQWIQRVIKKGKPVELRTHDLGSRESRSHETILQLLELTPALRHLTMWDSEEAYHWFSLPTDFLPQLESFRGCLRTTNLERLVRGRPIHMLQLDLFSEESPHVEELVTSILPQTTVPLRFLSLKIFYNHDSIVALSGKMPALERLQLSFLHRDTEEQTSNENLKVCIQPSRRVMYLH